MTTTRRLGSQPDLFFFLLSIRVTIQIGVGLEVQPTGVNNSQKCGQYLGARAFEVTANRHDGCSFDSVLENATVRQLGNPRQPSQLGGKIVSPRSLVLRQCPLQVGGGRLQVGVLLAQPLPRRLVKLFEYLLQRSRRLASRFMRGPFVDRGDGMVLEEVATIEKGSQAIEVGLADRVDLVIVALSTPD